MARGARVRVAAIVGLAAMLLVACRPLTGDPFTVLPVGDVALGRPNAAGLAPGLVAVAGGATATHPVLVDLTSDDTIPLPGLGGEFEYATAVNDHGVVVGRVDEPGPGPAHAAVWRQSLGWQLEVIDALGDGSALVGVNGSGVAVGYVTDQSTGSHRPIAYDVESGARTDIPLPGDGDTEAVAISDGGLVVGNVGLPDGTRQVWTYRLGDAASHLLPQPDGFSQSDVSGVDPTGTVVVGEVVDPSRHAVARQDGPGGTQSYASAYTYDLDTGEAAVFDPFGGGYAQVTGADARGIVVGTSRALDGTDHGFARDTTTGLIVDLGLIDGTGGVDGLAITDDLLVVGFGWDWTASPPVPTAIKTLLHTSPDAPPAPQVAGCAGAVRIAWSAPDFDGNYPIERYRVSREQDGVTSTVAIVGPTVRSVVDVDATSGPTTYRVVASNQLGGFSPSDPTTTTIASCPP